MTYIVPEVGDSITGFMLRPYRKVSHSFTIRALFNAMPLDPDDVAARSAAIHRSGPRAGQSVGTRLDRFSSALSRTGGTHAPGSSIGNFLLDFPMVLTCAKMAVGVKYRHMGRTRHLILEPTQRGTLSGGSRLSMTANAYAKTSIWDATITTAAK